MSAAEIADNRWELAASKPPVATPAGIAQILMMGVFSLIFGFIVIGSVIGLVSPKKSDGLADQYKSLKSEAAAPAPAE